MKRRLCLKNYEICQAESDASARNFWTTFGFFVSSSTAVIGGIIAFAVGKQEITQIHLIWLGLLLVFCILVLVVLFFLKSWLERVNHLLVVTNVRMREIEEKLGMETKRRIWGLDYWEILCKEENRKQYQELRKAITQSFASISEGEKQRIANCEQPLPDDYKPPETGRRLFCRKLFYPLISVWAILAVCIVGSLLYQLICWEWVFSRSYNLASIINLITNLTLP